MKGTVLQPPGRWLTWGATTGEVAATLPGDELLADPDVVSTRAVTIDAPPRRSGPGDERFRDGVVPALPRTGTAPAAPAPRAP
jgi:hypothetical protein